MGLGIIVKASTTVQPQQPSPAPYIADKFRCAVELVFLHLKPRDLKSCRLTCKEWRQIISSRRFAANYFPWLTRAIQLTHPLVTPLPPYRAWVDGLIGADGSTVSDVERHEFRSPFVVLPHRTSVLVQAHSKTVHCLQYTGRELVTGSFDGKVKFWDPTSLRCTKTLSPRDGAVCSMHWVDNTLFIGTSRGNISVWDTTTSTPQRGYSPHILQTNWVQKVGDNVFSCGGSKVVRTDLSNCEEFSVPTKQIWPQGFESMQVASGHLYVPQPEGKIGVYDVGDGHEVTSYASNLSRISFVRVQNNRLYAGGNNVIQIWDLQSQLHLCTISHGADSTPCFDVVGNNVYTVTARTARTENTSGRSL